MLVHSALSKTILSKPESSIHGKNYFIVSCLTNTSLIAGTRVAVKCVQNVSHPIHSKDAIHVMRNDCGSKQTMLGIVGSSAAIFSSRRIEIRASSPEEHLTFLRLEIRAGGSGTLASPAWLHVINTTVLITMLRWHVNTTMTAQTMIEKYQQLNELNNSSIVPQYVACILSPEHLTVLMLATDTANLSILLQINQSMSTSDLIKSVKMRIHTLKAKKTNP